METKTFPSMPMLLPSKEWLELADWLEEDAKQDELNNAQIAKQKPPSSTTFVGISSGAVSRGRISSGAILVD